MEAISDTNLLKSLSWLLNFKILIFLHLKSDELGNTEKCIIFKDIFLALQ